MFCYFWTLLGLTDSKLSLLFNKVVGTLIISILDDT